MACNITLEADLKADPLLSLPEVARAAGLSDSLIRRAVEGGELRSVTLAGRRFVRASWAAAWMRGENQWSDQGAPPCSCGGKDGANG